MYGICGIFLPVPKCAPDLHHRSLYNAPDLRYNICTGTHYPFRDCVPHIPDIHPKNLRGRRAHSSALCRAAAEVLHFRKKNRDDEKEKHQKKGYVQALRIPAGAPGMYAENVLCGMGCTAAA
jgi:hypothetical protein